MAYNPNQGYVVSAPVRAGMEVDLNTGAITKIVTENGVETPVLSALQNSLLLSGNSLTNDVLQQGPLPITVQTQAGASGSVSYGGKKRYLDWAGFPGKYFFRSGTMHITNVDFGTKTTDTPSNTALSAYVTDTETGGAQPALFTPTTTNGVMSMAGGRLTQDASGIIRIQQNADDALFVNCPRLQLWTAGLPSKKRIVHEFSFQLGDANTPWPAYDPGGKNNVLIWQLKGGTIQPPVALIAVRQANGSITILLNRKLTQAGVIFTAGTVNGLSTNSVIKVRLEFSIDWQLEVEGGTSYLSFSVNDIPVELFDSSANSERFVSTWTPVALTDYSTFYQVMVGIYRYDYSAVKAPNDSCMIISKYVMYRK